jgi:hypothetical protein
MNKRKRASSSSSSSSSSSKWVEIKAKVFEDDSDEDIGESVAKKAKFDPLSTPLDQQLASAQKKSSDAPADVEMPQATSWLTSPQRSFKEIDVLTQWLNAQRLVKMEETLNRLCVDRFADGLGTVVKSVGRATYFFFTSCLQMVGCDGQGQGSYGQWRARFRLAEEECWTNWPCRGLRAPCDAAQTTLASFFVQVLFEQKSDYSDRVYILERQLPLSLMQFDECAPAADIPLDVATTTRVFWSIDQDDVATGQIVWFFLVRGSLCIPILDLSVLEKEAVGQGLSSHRHFSWQIFAHE